VKGAGRNFGIEIVWYVALVVRAARVQAADKNQSYYTSEISNNLCMHAVVGEDLFNSGVHKTEKGLGLSSFSLDAEDVSVPTPLTIPANALPSSKIDSLRYGLITVGTAIPYLYFQQVTPFSSAVLTLVHVDTLNRTLCMYGWETRTALNRYSRHFLPSLTFQLSSGLF